MQKKKVAIIGAGPSGIVAAKETAAAGLVPILFEKATEVGGIWAASSGKAWPSMRTNISSYSCTFSDFPWSNGSPLFPSTLDMAGYLNAYCSEHALFEVLRKDSEVVKVSPSSGGWLVISNSGKGESADFFDFVIFASGVFDKPVVPSNIRIDDHSTTWQHAACYKGNEGYRGQDVIVVGGSFSGIEIAADIAKNANSVTLILRKPVWILPRLLKVDTFAPRPLDIAFFVRSNKNVTQTSEDESNRQKNKYFSELAKAAWGYLQGDICPALAIDPSSSDPPYIIISDDFLDAVKAGKINIRLGTVIEIKQDGIVLEDRSVVSGDATVLCTGYASDLSYMPKDMLKQLSFNERDQFLALPLYKATLRWEFSNAAFVGQYRGPYFAIMELQARWISQLFTEEKSWPDRDLMQMEIQKNEMLRLKNPRPQFPWDDYVSLADSLAREIDAFPRMTKDPHLNPYLFNGPLLPVQYRLNDFKSAAQANKFYSETIANLLARGWLNESPAKT